ncbi:anti-sigma factor domain-containing protein [Desulfofundulus thermobenzoicus]|uniref:Anti-sigma factor domain-containing protein n=1 Tax=Desulfofundulus thermobenzoicus TaxID=29376 RepID=A0A6N7IWZ9_9FIRM|nr:anti-sigma factor domain-containing protein [Desulfofundulus thermobenzoicus]MQL53688.1 anti-sigma factor domain-containing protein [Desulfofundulus thermobenzoicus]
MITGMVMEIRAKTCVILTPDGQFREVPLPPGGVRLGEEITCPSGRYISWRWLVAAACFLIFLGSGLLYYGWTTRAMAYVSMDINPSVELTLNRREYVCAARGLNPSGEQLLAGTGLLGRPLEEAINTLVARAVQSKYLLPDKNNVVLTAVTAENGQAVPPAEKVYRFIASSLQSVGVGAEVVVETTTPEMRRQAQKAGLSTGRYLLHVEAVKKGLDIGLEELKKESMTVLEEKKGFAISELLGGRGYAGWVGPGSRLSGKSPRVAGKDEQSHVSDDGINRRLPGKVKTDAPGHADASTSARKKTIPVEPVLPAPAPGHGLPGFPLYKASSNEGDENSGGKDGNDQGHTGGHVTKPSINDGDKEIFRLEKQREEDNQRGRVMDNERDGDVQKVLNHHVKAPGGYKECSSGQ